MRTATRPAVVRPLPVRLTASRRGRSRLGALLLVAAPVSWFLGWALQSGWGDLSPVRTAAQALWLLAFAGFAGAAIELFRRTLPRPFVIRTLGAGMSLFGTVALGGQLLVDIIAGRNAVTDDDAVLFQLGPVLFVAGVLLQLAVLAAQRRRGWSSVAYMLAGILCSQLGRGVNGLGLMEGLFAFFVLVALLPYARPRRPALDGMINRRAS